VIELESRSAADTEAVAAELARLLRLGDVVAISGELGSGKTTFVRGACRALGVGDRITSPTFTIAHRYTGDTTVSHLDLFRFADVSNAEWGDLEVYFDGAIAFVEWPDVGRAMLPTPRVEVVLEHLGGDSRHIRVESPDARLLQGMARAHAGFRHGD
jgi:tRNA threonylcarbamoyladenosine biosynthesis protein TsaE